MGGTTAKICLLTDGEPERARKFEIARAYRDMKGSGLPVRIPVIEMVEIGAGGGSIARVDRLQRITVGPDSAGSTPGPACYGRGGAEPTVTDANLVLGKIDPDHFAGGKIALDQAAAEEALRARVGTPLALSPSLAGCRRRRDRRGEHGQCGARPCHRARQGHRRLHHDRLRRRRTAACLPARREARRSTTIVVPRGAGVGSAIGFLQRADRL